MDNISSVNFQGNVYIMNGLSYKPEYHIRNASKYLQKLVENKDYNIYIKQNYVLSKINITVATRNEFIEKKGNTGTVHITSAARKYIETAESVINEYNAKKQEIYEKRKQKENIKDDIKGILGSLLYIPVLIIDSIKEETDNIIKTIKCLQKKKG